MSFTAKITFDVNGRTIESPVPEKEVNELVEFAEKEFDGNVGMAFKELMQALILRPEEFYNIYSILKEYEGRLLTLEKGKPNDEGFVERKTLSGRVIKYKPKNRQGGE